MNNRYIGKMHGVIPLKILLWTPLFMGITLYTTRYESEIPAFLLFLFTLRLRLYRANAETMEEVFHSLLGVICASEERYAEPCFANVCMNLR